MIPAATAPPAKTVALVDPLWVGHHPMYFSQFTGAFLRLGAFVIGLCPKPEEAFAGAKTALGASFPDFDRRVSMHKLPGGKRSFFGGRFEGDPIRTYQRWKRCADMLFEAEQATGRRADLVFFPYLDSYLRFLPFPAIPHFTIDRPWSGLYLRNHHFGEAPSAKKQLRLLAKGDALIRSPLCRGIGVLDERFVEPMQAYLGRQVHGFPDVTDASLPGSPYLLAREILRKAAGRKVIGLIGMERRKGLLNLMRVAEKARELRLPWYFACAGRFERPEYTPEELAFVDATAARIASGEIDNLHFELDAGRIPEEADFNSIFNTFDVAWAAYEDFEGSSGALGKAASYDIPCLATAGECIGDRVERYRTGLTIPQGDSDKALEAIQRILDNKDWNDGPLESRHAAFREAHGLARLDMLLAGFLNGA
ncbi:glycosyltransferase [Luteolibacter luteus]|uniref:Glycosyltransferase n=1 Tax=Luteolibacter luteus TaxID=2728835 RepID=A0A858RQY2_9BACT|nr:glycosyltransferase [Luteolibacter luteus]QJE98530.1 glycosyltransferase [Luteolibacter luteus]